MDDVVREKEQERERNDIQYFSFLSGKLFW